jgi:hypothetical protein
LVLGPRIAASRLGAATFAAFFAALGLRFAFFCRGIEVSYPNHFFFFGGGVGADCFG